MLWINKDIEAEQVLIESPDMTAVIQLPEQLVLVVSVYLPEGDTQALQNTCNNLCKAVSDIRQDASTVVEVVIVGDFNRHNQL
jgi:exonuclease III